MARFPRTLGEALASQAEAGRSTRTEVMSVEPLVPIALEHLDEILQENIETVNTDLGTLANTMADMEITQGESAIELARLDGDLIQLDADLIQLDADLAANQLAVTESMGQLAQDLTELDAELALVPGQITEAINDSNALPITNDRFTEDSLSIWPFIQGAIPHGALATGAVGAGDLADFVLTARKFKDDRHRLY